MVDQSLQALPRSATPISAEHAPTKIFVGDICRRQISANVNNPYGAKANPRKKRQVQRNSMSLLNRRLSECCDIAYSWLKGSVVVKEFTDKAKAK